MNEKINSAIEGVKDIAEKVHISDKIHEVGDKIKETVRQVQKRWYKRGRACCNR